MNKFTVDRSKWYRGQGSAGSYLLKPDGEMCCVGFQCLAAGISEEEILAIGSVANITNKIPASLCEMYTYNLGRNNSSVSLEIYFTNDNPALELHERESKLKKLFAEINWEVNFIN